MRDPDEARAVASHSQSFSHGTVFGLTVAEIFILLVFVLLMIFLTFLRQVQEERESIERQLVETRHVIDRWNQVISAFETPEEVLTLTAAPADSSVTLNEIRETLAAVNDDPQRPLEEQVKEAVHKLQSALAEVATMKKGVNPPCWYEVVQDAEGTREKPHYTFEIGVFDDGIFVRPLPVPVGGARDDGASGSYAVEADSLALGELPLDRKLSDQEFLVNFNRIREAGKSGDVRSYSCIFWTKVWDLTSAGAKARWKHVHLNVIEPLFGAYVVRSDPWEAF